MALIQFTYVSGLLERAVPVQVILPADKLSPQGEFLPLKKYKTLYLLNGYLGCHTDWVSGTRIQRWAEERDLAVVMPSGDNSFYVDRPKTGNCYGEFVGRELHPVLIVHGLADLDAHQHILHPGILFAQIMVIVGNHQR